MELKHITDESWEQDVAKAEGLVLVDFWAPWCGPCRMLAPSLEAAAEQYAGKVTIVKYNVDESSAMAQELGIRGIPTLVAYKDGQIVEQHVGAMPRSQLFSFIEDLF